jgi:hypothetical protein
MSEWQPIETAPKDGTEILAWDGSVRTTAVWWVPGKQWSLVSPGEYAEDSEVWPTHWMPLPEPPNLSRDCPAARAETS